MCPPRVPSGVGEMKICVVGTGAIGGYMAARLCAAHDVSVVTRDP